MKYVVLIILLGYPFLSHSEVYRWVDENGQIHFGSVPPKVQKPYKAGELESAEKGQKDSDVQSQDLNTSEVSDKPTGEKKISNQDQVDKEVTRETETDKVIKKFKPRTEEEKRQDAERDRKRGEKFDALINRLKNELGVIKYQEQEDSHEKAMNQGERLTEKKENTTTSLNDNVLDSESGDDSTSKKEHEDEEVRNELESVEQAEIHVNEKCGFFKSFVDNYEDRVKYECPSEHCNLLQKKLEKYRNKVKEYCGEEDEREVEEKEKNETD